MQDEVRDKSVALAISVGKTGGRLTADAIKAAMRHYLSAQKNPKIRHGKQTVRHLVENGGTLKEMEVRDVKIRSFDKIARKYGIDYAITRQKDTGAYHLFFKSKDDAAMTAAFREFTAGIVTRKKDGEKAKPSLLKQLAHFKEVVKKSIEDRVKNREKGEMSL